MKNFEINKDFKPDPRFKTYNLIATILAVTGLVWLSVGWAAFLIMDIGLELVIVYLAIITIIPLIIIPIWNVLYYRSIVYHLNPTEMTWKHGVWFRKTGIVPYNRITNVDIVQGPVMRMFKISTLRIQTAGYSGQNTAEIRIQGIEDAEPLREMIMDFVRNKPPVASATGGEDDTSTGRSPENNEIISELKEIKEILREISMKRQ
ncbi:PH domain-containing protein [Methanoplanus sp. FWC-SCC4]|uniref:PH domain-containing protein n=1 Tax=Methanochimaera problematica TaxID=2609417 RepID=A0AA97FBS4_9EURY|nr:PH domain-containing protein [Methanoplanus sp. FWC-SCC4]WOF15304.1 PH domain-containing protein [Methanoplanus sp. FWC-SCC4]